MSAAQGPLERDESTGAPVGKDPKNPHRDDRINRMGTASIPKLLVEFAIPAIIGMVVNGAYNIIDSVFLGQAMGEIGLSTMTVAFPIMTIFMALAMLIGNGGNALAALKLGEGKRTDAETSLGNTILLSVIVSIIVAGCALTPPIMNALLDISSTPADVRPYAYSFIRILCFGFFLQCIGFGVNNFIRTAGAPNRALGTMIIGAVSCVIFNFLFVIQFGWGVEGSALATVCGQGVSCIAVVWYFVFTKNVPLRIRVRFMKPKLRIMGLILSLGFASFIVQAAMAIVNFVINYDLVVYGVMHPIGATNALSAIGVVQRVAFFTVLPLIGMAVAAQPLLGFNYGAKKIARVRKTLWYSVLGATGFAILGWLLVHFFPTQIVHAFGINEPGLVEFTANALKVQLMLLPFIGFQIVGSNYFQATGQPLKSSILSLTRQILFLVPLLIVLPHILPDILEGVTSLDAIYYATPIADFLSIFTVGVVIIFEMRRLKRLEKKYGPEGHPGDGSGAGSSSEVSAGSTDRPGTGLGPDGEANASPADGLIASSAEPRSSSPTSEPTESNKAEQDLGPIERVDRKDRNGRSKA